MTVIDRDPPALREPANVSAEPVPRDRSRWIIATLGLGAFLLSFIGNCNPSLWYDEVATVTSATRTWPQLAAEIQHVDAVHALYYSFMHVLFQVVGYSPLVLRLPSAIAVGAATVLVILLVRKVASFRAAIFAGVVFGIMPRVTWMGGEGRSYALTALAAVALTLVLLVALRQTRRRWWILYGVVAVVSVLLFAYLGFVIVAHVITVAVRYRQRRVLRRDLFGFGIASAGALLVLSPFLVLVHSEKGQVSWLPVIDWDIARQVYETQWFWGSGVWPLVGWALLVAGAVRLLRKRHSELAALILPAALLPTALIIAVSMVGPHLYSPRYLSMCTPFVAILVGYGLDWFRRRWLPVVVIAGLGAFGLFHQVTAQRVVEAKSHSSWVEVASGLAAHRAALDGSDPTAIVYGPVFGHHSATTRVIEYAYPSAFADTTDVTLRTPAAETGRLWETSAPLADSTGALSTAEVTYVITSTKDAGLPAKEALLESLGWQQTTEWHYTNVDVIRYVRG